MPQSSGYFKGSIPHRLGADRKTPLCLYQSLVRSKLDYAWTGHGAALKRVLQKLDPIRHQGLRIALAAFLTSRVTSLCAKAQEMSLKNIRKKLSMNFVLKLKACPNNPAYSCVFEPPNSVLFLSKSKLTPRLGRRILTLLQNSKIDFGVVDDGTVSDTPPWRHLSVFDQIFKRLHKPWHKQKQVVCFLFLLFLSVFFCFFYYITAPKLCEDFYGWLQNRRGCCYSSIIDHCFIYTAELQAILFALRQTITRK